MATVPTLKERLLEAGAVNCDAAAFDAVRIEAGWPLFGRDITPENLPQEVDRDAYAISFKKGCYLGQETVARIDAMGHVNRKLRRLKFAGDAAPAPGTALLAGDKHVGEVTSAAISPNFGAPLALGYVRRGHNEPGTRLISSAGEVEVLAP
jgi:folate-binding protein YgfZ